MRFNLFLNILNPNLEVNVKKSLNSFKYFKLIESVYLKTFKKYINYHINLKNLLGLKNIIDIII